MQGQFARIEPSGQPDMNRAVDNDTTNTACSSLFPRHCLHPLDFLIPDSAFSYRQLQVHPYIMKYKLVSCSTNLSKERP